MNTNSRSNKIAKYVLTLPVIIFVVVCVAYPMAYTFRLSFFTWKMSAKVDPVFVGLANYKTYFSDERFWQAFARTLYYTGIAVCIETVLGVSYALLLNRIRRGSSIIKTIFLIPMVTTPVAVGMLWKLIYDPTIGLANVMLRSVGLPVSQWLGNSTTVIPSLLIIDIWQWTPNIMLIVLAGLSGLDSQLIESAKIDGANTRQIIGRIILPILTPTIMMAILLRLVDCLKTFDIIYSTTTGGPGYSSENLNILSYKTAFEYIQMGNACTLLVIFFVVVCGFAILFSMLRKKVEERYE